MSSRWIVARVANTIRERPILFNSLTGFLLCAGSDAIAQKIESSKGPQGVNNTDDGTDSGHVHHRDDDVNPQTMDGARALLEKESFDYHRVLSAGFIGAFFGGFVYPFAYARLDTLWKGVHFSSVFKKSVVEIGTVGIFVNCISMSSRGLLGGHESEHVAQHVFQEMPTVTMNDVRVWLPYNLVAFSIIPVHIRPSTTAMMEATWQAYISIRSNAYKENI
eukprot:scaffold12959_cov53-Attheya_sp.AAC.5